MGLVAGSGRHPGEGNDNSLQYYHLENPTDLWRAWQTIAHGVTKSWTRLRTEHVHTKVKKVKVLDAQLCPTLWDPVDCSLARLLCPRNSPGKHTRVGNHSFTPSYLSNPGIKSGFLALQMNSLLSESKEVLFTIAKTQKWPKCPSRDEWIKMWYIYTKGH